MMANSIPPFSDISKLSNDLLNKDFYHLHAAALEVKSQTPNGVNFKVNGKTSHESTTGGALEVKYTDKSSGVTLTQGWTTTNALDTKVELKDVATKGLKAELITAFLPNNGSKNAKLHLYYQQPHFHTRAFFDLLKGPTAKIDAVIGNDGFLAGGELAYDVAKASITQYSAAVGYNGPGYVAAITATSNLSVFSASYYHKVSPQVEASGKAVWDSKASGQVGLEVASKFRHDPLSFTKAKINDRGIAAVAYNVLLRPSVNIGLGASFDTTKLDQANPKIGASLTFES